MNLARKWFSSSRMNGERFEKLKLKIIREPMSILTTSFSELDDPELYILSPQLYNILKGLAEAAQLLTQDGSEYGELKKEILRLRSLVRGLTRELTNLKGEDYQISDEFWKSINDSVLEAVEENTGQLQLG